MIVEFIDEHVGERDGEGLRWGVESICAQLTELGAKIAPATYYEHRTRRPTARAVRDEQLKPQVARVHAENYGVYGARKVWLALNRERPAGAPPIARCTVERLMGELGLRGAVRGKVKRTTIADPGAKGPGDLVRRHFAPLAPDRLWVADFTYVSTWAGWVYVAFVIDAYARRIIGWRSATSMTSQLVLDAIEHAVWTRGRDGRPVAGVIHHHDHGSQGGFNWSSQHLVIVEVFDGSSAAGSRPGGAAEAEVAGASEVPARDRVGVLGPDRRGAVAGGGRQGRGCVAARGQSVVPRRWRDVSVRSEAAHGPVSVVS
ncbi:integrase core domain protein [mine drainage metagenome]|uniref:Integrase core domain protein n=1 Tax=mine drainage metagenome TaxID=410659 RepID=A0A1J5R3E0_9ZZZZ